MVDFHFRDGRMLYTQAAAIIRLPNKHTALASYLMLRVTLTESNVEGHAELVKQIGAAFKLYKAAPAENFPKLREVYIAMIDKLPRIERGMYTYTLSHLLSKLIFLYPYMLL